MLNSCSIADTGAGTAIGTGRVWCGTAIGMDRGVLWCGTATGTGRGSWCGTAIGMGRDVLWCGTATGTGRGSWCATGTGRGSWCAIVGVRHAWWCVMPTLLTTPLTHTLPRIRIMAGTTGRARSSGLARSDSESGNLSAPSSAHRLAERRACVFLKCFAAMRSARRSQRHSRTSTKRPAIAAAAAMAGDTRCVRPL